MKQPNPSDPKYQKPDGTFDTEKYQTDLQRYQESLTTTSGPGSGMDPEQQQRGSGTGAPPPPPYSPTAGSGLPSTPAPPSVGSGGDPASARPYNWWKSQNDDFTNDGGPDFANAKFEDSETKNFTEEGQRGMAAAKAAGDEAGYNGIKDAERAAIANGDRVPGNPNRIPESVVQSMGWKSVLDLMRSKAMDTTGYDEELSTYDPGEPEKWAARILRGDIEGATKIRDAQRARGGR